MSRLHNNRLVGQRNNFISYWEESFRYIQRKRLLIRLKRTTLRRTRCLTELLAHITSTLRKAAFVWNALRLWAVFMSLLASVATLLKTRQSEIVHFAPGALRAAADWCRHLAYSTKHNVVFDSAPLVPLCENMTTSTKPEVRKILHCRQRRNEPQVQK